MAQQFNNTYTTHLHKPGKVLNLMALILIIKLTFLCSSKTRQGTESWQVGSL